MSGKRNGYCRKKLSRWNLSLQNKILVYITCLIFHVHKGLDELTFCWNKFVRLFLNMASPFVMQVHGAACSVNKLSRNRIFESMKISFILRVKHLQSIIIEKLDRKLHILAIFGVIQGNYDIIWTFHFDVNKEICFKGNSRLWCTSKRLSVETNINKVWILPKKYECYCIDLMLQ